MLIRKTLIVAALAALTATAASGQGATHNTAKDGGAVAVGTAWSRATAPSARNGGAYMTIRNASTAPDRLVSASSPVAERAELHTHTMTDSVMRMRPVEDGIVVPSNGTVELKPGGLHVMLLGLKAPLAEGTDVPITLTFEHAGKITIHALVMNAGASSPGQNPMGDHGKMDGHGAVEGHGKAMPAH
jgi:periplasmic copper chaperone A